MTVVVDPEPGGPLGDMIPVITRLAREAVEQAATGPLAGPTFRPGTVGAASAPGQDTVVTLDGPDGGSPITAPNVSGAGLLAGSRVIVMFLPPHGVYITSSIDSTAVPSGTPVWNVATSEEQMPGFLAFGQTISNGASLFPVLWARVPAGWKSGVNLVLPAIGKACFVAYDGTAGFSAIGMEGGSPTHTLTAAQSGVPAHTHPAGGNGVYVGGGAGKIQGDGTYGFNLDSSINANSAANASQSHPIMGPYVVMNPYLKT